jgi:hypothetical protein
MTTVMGLDQHRAQAAADWLDTATSQVSRARVAPADRIDVRLFLSRFGGQELEAGAGRHERLAVRGRGVRASGRGWTSRSRQRHQACGLLRPFWGLA